ncbi:MAG: response regulator transcription factor [Hyphomicrobiales bacterium]|nr:response regulator transcription factor [Hyphomicrobiales bacterium]
MRSKKETQSLAVINSILVIDDHPLYCDALASTIERIFEAKTVRKAASLNEAMRIIRSKFLPDLVMLDLKLPDVTGISGFLKIKNKMPDVPVLVISAESSDATMQTLINAGAAGFVPKDASHKILQKALMDVREGRRFLPPGYNHPARPSRNEVGIHQMAKKIANLTPQQSRIIKLICAGKQNKQIAYEMCLAEATVKAHITALLRRLGVNNRTQAAVLVKSAGLDHPSDISEEDARALLS